MQQAQTANNVHELPESPTMSDIEALTKNYADARQRVVDRVTTMNEEIEAIKRKHMRWLKSDVSAAKEQESILVNAISRAKELFDKPKTQIFHGIKVGIRKLVGRLTWADDEQTSKLIQKHFPEQYEAMVKVTRKPINKALMVLKAEQLLKIGVTLGNDSDEPVISPVDSEVDKLVEALLKDSADEAV